jgi:hypothetical protein
MVADATRTRREARPTRRFSDDIADLIKWAPDYARRSVSLDPADARPSDVVPDMVTGALPFAGAPQAGRDLVRSAREGSKLGMALNSGALLLSTLPFVGTLRRGAKAAIEGVEAEAKVAATAGRRAPKRLPTRPEKLSDAQAEKIAEAMRANPDGGSINPVTGKPLTRGVMVANPPGTKAAPILRDVLPDAKMVQELWKQNPLFRQDGKLHMGWWRDGETGEMYFETTKAHPDRASALKAMEGTGEKAAFDLSDFSEVANPNRVPDVQPERFTPSTSAIKKLVENGGTVVRPVSRASLGPTRLSNAQRDDRISGMLQHLRNLTEPPIDPNWKNASQFMREERDMVPMQSQLADRYQTPVNGQVGLRNQIIPEDVAALDNPMNIELQQTIARRGWDSGGETWYPSGLSLRTLAERLGLDPKMGDSFNALTAPGSAQTPVVEELVKGTLVNHMKQNGIPLTQANMREVLNSFAARSSNPGAFSANLMLPDAVMERMSRAGDAGVADPIANAAGIIGSTDARKVPMYSMSRRVGGHPWAVVPDTRTAQGLRLGSNYPEMPKFGEALSDENDIIPLLDMINGRIAKPMGMRGDQFQASQWTGLVGTGLIPSAKTGGGDFLHLFENTMANGMEQLGMPMTQGSFDNYLRDILTGKQILPSKVTTSSVLDRSNRAIAAVRGAR